MNHGHDRAPSLSQRRITVLYGPCTLVRFIQEYCRNTPRGSAAISPFRGIMIFVYDTYLFAEHECSQALCMLSFPLLFRSVAAKKT